MRIWKIGRHIAGYGDRWKEDASSEYSGRYYFSLGRPSDPSTWSVFRDTEEERDAKAMEILEAVYPGYRIRVIDREEKP